MAGENLPADAIAACGGIRTLIAAWKYRDYQATHLYVFEEEMKHFSSAECAPCIWRAHCCQVWDEIEFGKSDLRAQVPRAQVPFNSLACSHSKISLSLGRVLQSQLRVQSRVCKHLVAFLIYTKYPFFSVTLGSSLKQTRRVQMYR